MSVMASLRSVGKQLALHIKTPPEWTGGVCSELV